MRQVLNFVSANDSYLLLGLACLSFILLIYSIWLSSKLGRVTKRRNARLDEGRIVDIVDCLTEHSDAITRLAGQVETLGTGQSRQGEVLSGCVQKVGIVRYNAFDDVGGEQSFALALLDDQGKGVVISSIYGRQDSRLYAKPVNAGEGDRALSEEERRAVHSAAG